MDLKIRVKFLVYIAVLLLSPAAYIQAGLDVETYGFYCITNNSIVDGTVGQQQLSVEVSDRASGLVGFKFINTGPLDCVISEIYFQDGSLLGFSSINESLFGVDFKEMEVGDVSPGNLPGGKSITPEFIATTAFSIEPLNPEPTWGVGPEEWVEIVYTLQDGRSYGDIIDELDNGNMRIGIHVKSFGDGFSESFVNVPEPMTLSSLGLGGLLLRKRK